MAKVDLTSLDYMRLIAWMAYFRNGVILNKTQMQKLLFICYGVGLADKPDCPIFTDDTPKAWPFGPVFPITYKRYVENYPTPLTETEKVKFTDSVGNLAQVDEIVSKYCHYPSVRLSGWSHQTGSPWAQTVFAKEGVKWNRPISLDAISEYFKGDWSKGLE